MVLFLLPNKHFTMVNREGIEEKKVFLIISLEVTVQLKEDLEASLESLWAYTIMFLYLMSKLGLKTITSSDRVLAEKKSSFIFLHDVCKASSF